MSFMQPEFYAEDCAQIYTDTGDTFCVPVSVCNSRKPSDYADYKPEGISGKPKTMEIRKNVICWRLSAPGYLDCTDWNHADDIETAVSDCLEMFGDGFDSDDCQLCADELGENFAEFAEGYWTALGFTSRKSFDDDSNIFGNFAGREFDVESSEIVDYVKSADEEKYAELLGDLLDFYLANLAKMAMLIENEMLRSWDYCGQLFHYARNGHGVTWTDNCDTYTYQDQRRMLNELQSASKVYGSAELIDTDIIG